MHENSRASAPTHVRSACVSISAFEGGSVDLVSSDTGCLLQSTLQTPALLLRNFLNSSKQQVGSPIRECASSRDDPQLQPLFTKAPADDSASQPAYPQTAAAQVCTQSARRQLRMQAAASIAGRSCRGGAGRRQVSVQARAAYQPSACRLTRRGGERTPTTRSTSQIEALQGSRQQDPRQA